jgi:hypothetical protein
MKLSIDISTQVSGELSSLMERMTGDPDRAEPATLGDVQAAVRRRTSAAERREESLHPQQSASILGEIDNLVDEFGSDALAIDFVAAKASEALSRIIETAMNDPRVRRRPTLNMIRDEMVAGLIARLVGDGVIEPDEDQTLLAEIDGFIERYGRDARAEELIRFE